MMKLISYERFTRRSTRSREPFETEMAKTDISELATQENLRRLWKASKIYSVPLTDPKLRDLNQYDLLLMEYLEVFEDPEVLDKFKRTIHDDEFDELWNETAPPKEEEPDVFDESEWEEVK